MRRSALFILGVISVFLILLPIARLGWHPLSLSLFFVGSLGILALVGVLIQSRIYPEVQEFCVNGTFTPRWEAFTSAQTPPMPSSLPIDITPRGQFESEITHLGIDFGTTFSIHYQRERDPVDCTVFAPPEVKAGAGLMVQVWIHLPGQYDEARTAALEADAEARRRGGTSLATEIARGSKLTFELIMPLVEIDEPIQEIVWQGRATSLQFGVDVPMDTPTQSLIGKVMVSQDSVPIGQIRFKLTITETAQDKAAEPTGEAQRYQMAFISYASQDRGEVLRRVQMLSAVGIRFFQDLLTLEPGQNWEQEIYHHIDGSDIMFLFWTTAAKQSEWVEKEWRYALKRGVEDFIRPVIIEGPPVVPPPPELAHLHFNDRVLYFILVEDNIGGS